MASGISITTKSESKLCALNNLRKSFAPFVGEEPPFVGEEPEEPAPFVGEEPKKYGEGEI